MNHLISPELFFGGLAALATAIGSVIVNLMMGRANVSKIYLDQLQHENERLLQQNSTGDQIGEARQLYLLNDRDHYADLSALYRSKLIEHNIEIPELRRASDEAYVKLPPGPPVTP